MDSLLGGGYEKDSISFGFQYADTGNVYEHICGRKRIQ